jgi:hypothetical protein
MARLFDIDKNRIVPDPNVLAIPAMRKLWDRDKHKDKINALKDLSYVVFLHDFHSPYRDLRWEEKEKVIITDLYKDNKWTPDSDILEACEIYKKLQITPSMRMLTASKKAIEKMSDWFETFDFNETDMFGKPKYSANDLSRNLKEIGNIVKSLTSLERQVRLEIEEQTSRGNNEIGVFEDPDEDDEIDNTFDVD